MPERERTQTDKRKNFYTDMRNQIVFLFNAKVYFIF